MNVNLVVLAGNLTRDPELKYVSSGKPVVNLALAVNRNYKKSDGTKAKETSFIDCEAWDSAAELINEYCKKGDPIFIQGSLKMDSWTNTDGENRNKLKVRITSFEFVPRGNKTSNNEGSEDKDSSTSQEYATADASSGDPDIPF